ncbi:MAG: winged helix-turn-helix domain-containing protein [Kibdelosporangium sp.]
MLLSSFKLLGRPQPAHLRPWVRQLRTARAWSPCVRPGLRLLAELAPRGPYFPDFLTPAEGGSGLDEGLEAILRTPQHRLTQELNLLATCGRSSLPAWLNLLITDSAAALRHVTSTLRDYHDAAIAPYEDLIKAAVDADRAHRAHSLLNGGIDGLLGGLRPLMHWEPPVLHVRYDVDKDMHLCGRGLRLVPSFFCHGSPTAIADSELPPVLIYPIAPEHRWTQATVPNSRGSLRKLLGTTRADVLLSIDHGANTTELARTLNTSLAAVSRHTGVLRDAGLITSHRHGPAVLHTLTPVGTQLLKYNKPHD